MIRTVDISKLLTSGDLSDLRPISGLSRTLRLALSTDDALDLDPAASVSDRGSLSAKNNLGDHSDNLFSRNLNRSGHIDGLPSDAILASDDPLEARSRVTAYLRGRKYGKGSAVVNCVGFIAPLGQSKLTAAGKIGNGSLSLECSGAIALLANLGLTETISANGNVSNATYQILDYRWGPDITNQWYTSGDPSPFPDTSLEVGDKIWLALRVRLSEGAVMLGSDWSLLFQVPGNPWFQVSSSTNTFKIVDYTSMIRVMPDDYLLGEINWSHHVTRPGPGNPNTGYRIPIATQDDQSPRVTNSAPPNSEVEVWYPLEITQPTYPVNAGTPLNFSIVSTNSSTRVIPGNSVTTQGWFDLTITP